MLYPDSTSQPAALARSKSARRTYMAPFAPPCRPPSRNRRMTITYDGTQFYIVSPRRLPARRRRFFGSCRRAAEIAIRAWIDVIFYPSVPTGGGFEFPFRRCGDWFECCDRVKPLRPVKSKAQELTAARPRSTRLSLRRQEAPNRARRGRGGAHYLRALSRAWFHGCYARGARPAGHQDQGQWPSRRCKRAAVSASPWGRSLISSRTAFTLAGSTVDRDRFASCGHRA
jgi:hypothetical protein